MENPFQPGYYNESELRDFGFGSVGRNVLVARNCTIVGLANIFLGDNVRIDGYSTLVATPNGRIELGSYIHIGGYCFMSASHPVRMGDFSGLSQGVRIYTKSDDYTGKKLTNPTVPAQYTGGPSGAVELGRHVIVGSGSIILPGIEIGEGASVGALSLVNRSLEGWNIYSGCPARRLRARSRELLELEQQLRGGQHLAT